MTARVARFVRFARFVSLVTGGVMSASCLQPVTAAEITLQVREPFGINRRASEVTTVAWSVNGADDSVSFIAGTPVATSQIPLGVANQVVDVSVLLGANPAEPTALGRANRTALPRIDEAEVVDGAALALNAFVFLAAPNLAEPLDNGVPAARTGTAACDNDDGRVRVVGGQQNNAYRFELDLLRVTGAFNFEADEKAVACDVSDKDVPIAVRATCPGGTTHDVVLALGTADEVVIPPVAGAACAPFVRIIGDIAWVASEEFVEIVAISANSIEDTVTLGGAGIAAHHVLVDDNTLVVQRGSETFIVTRDGFTLAPTSPALEPIEPIAAADPNSNAVVLASDKTLRRVTVNAAGQATLSDAIGPPFGIEPAHLLVLGDGRGVALSALGALQIQGSPSIDTGRETMALTFGDAILLFGGGSGHDMVVAP